MEHAASTDLRLFVLTGALDKRTRRCTLSRCVTLGRLMNGLALSAHGVRGSTLTSGNFLRRTRLRPSTNLVTLLAP